MVPGDSADQPSLIHQGSRIVEVSEDAGQRVDNFLVRILKDVPKSRVYKMIRKGEVRVNGGRIKPTHRLKEGDRVRIPPHHGRPQTAPVFVGDRALDTLERAILHEDEQLLVLDKPAGLAVHGGSGVAFGAIEGLRRLRPQASLELVHRLDRDTSGCLLVAKRRSVLRTLHAQLREGELHKRYTLIVHGQWPVGLARVALGLTRYVTKSGERRVRPDPAGKPSATCFSVLQKSAGATLLGAELETGRTHQIRVHARTSGHSIVGDEKYASAEELSADRGLGVTRLCLHASSIGIPTAQGLVTFESPLPAAFRKSWEALSCAADAG